MPGKASDAVKGSPARYREAGRKAKEAVTGKGSIGDGSMSKMDRLRAAGSAAKDVAPEAVAATGLAGAGAYGMSKKSSALNILAEARAMEVLAEHGIGVEDHGQDKLASAVDQRAYEMLVEAGFIDP